MDLCCVDIERWMLSVVQGRLSLSASIASGERPVAWAICSCVKSSPSIRRTSVARWRRCPRTRTLSPSSRTHPSRTPPRRHYSKEPAPRPLRARGPCPSKRSLPGLKYVESQGPLSSIERRGDRIVVRLLTIGPGAPILQPRSA